ncbi:hypothetical protein ACFQX4_13790 [Roseomonas sp. GCM10028921]
MSRNLAALTAAFAFTAMVAAGGVQAQTSMGGSAGGMPSGMGSTTTGSTGMNSNMNSGPAGSGGMPMPAPQASQGGMQDHSMHGQRAMRGERRAMRRQDRASRRAANDENGAYMGGGGVYERLPDGTLRPVM